MTCPKCGSENIQVVTDTRGKIKKRGCLGTLLWLPIIIVTGIFGIILALLTGGSHGKVKTKTMAVCMNCGHKWKI